MKRTQLLLRTLGFFGILGGLILFSGDMLFYYSTESNDLVLNMGNTSGNRIIISGITALLGTWFYLLGLVQVYFAFKPSSKIMQNIVIVSFTSILTAYGIIHGAYIAIATSAKLSVLHNLNIEDATALAIKTNNILRLFVYPGFAILSFVFIRQVWKRKTLYPRWIIPFFPLFPFLFQGILNKLFSGSIKIIIMGGFFNLILVIFFIASTVALWNKQTE